MPPSIRIETVDWNDPKQAHQLVEMLDVYANDLMGGGEGLSLYTKDNLARELANRPSCVAFLALDDQLPVGLLICFEGFSTFACKPILNLHDLVVRQSHRGLGISKLLMQRAESEARQRGCCKLTLEVLSGNEIAKKAYIAFGFEGYQLDPTQGQALFWQKKL